MSYYRLTLVACGAAKIWKRRPEPLEVPAEDAYIGTPFLLGRRYCEKFVRGRYTGFPTSERDEWAILSAKYGVLPPKQLIRDYNVKMSPETTDAAYSARFVEAVIGYDGIRILGGSEYVDGVVRMLKAAGKPLNVDALYPEGGLFKIVAGLSEAIKTGTPLPARRVL